MIEPLRLLERKTLIAPLGVRFWDVATGGYVSDGLRVTAYPDNDRLQSTEATPNRSGTFVLHHASGLHSFEMNLGNLPFTDLLPARQRFTVEVRDERRRFLPLKFEADLPCKGFFKWRGSMTPRGPLDPPDNSSSVPLFSSILRPAPAGMAVLRAELYESPSREINNVRIMMPAAWAVLEARSQGRLLGRGIADEKGRLALIFAYPPPRDPISSLGSPPARAFTAGIPFLQQEWTIQLQAYYEPIALSSPPASPPAPLRTSSRSDPSIPNLRGILDQSPVNLFLDEARTEPLTEVSLRYGSEFFVPALSPPVSSPLEPKVLSILFISPAG